MVNTIKKQPGKSKTDEWRYLASLISTAYDCYISTDKITHIANQALKLLGRSYWRCPTAKEQSKINQWITWMEKHIDDEVKQ